MKKFSIALIFSLLTCTLVYAQEKEQDRLKEAGNVLKEILDIPDDIPKSVLDRAECVIVIPSVKKLAVGIGATMLLPMDVRIASSEARSGPSPAARRRRLFRIPR